MWSAEDVSVWASTLASEYRTCDGRAATSLIERFISNPALLESVLLDAPRQEIRRACAEVVCAALTNLVNREESILLENNSLLTTSNSSNEMDVETAQSSPPQVLRAVTPSRSPIPNLSGSNSLTLSSGESGPLRIPPIGTPKAISAQFMDTLLRKFESIEEHMCAFNEYFAIITAFAKAGGVQEIEFLLDRRVVTALLDLFVGNESPATTPPPASSSPVKRKRTPMSRNSFAPAYSGLVEAIAAIIGGCKEHGLYALPPDSSRVRLSHRNRERLLREDFYERAFGCGLIEEPLAVLHNLPGLTEAEVSIVVKLINIGFERLPSTALSQYAAVLAKRLSSPEAPPQLASLLARDLFVNIICKRPGSACGAALAAVGESLLKVPGFAGWLKNNLCEWVLPLLVPVQSHTLNITRPSYVGGYSSPHLQKVDDVPEKAYKILLAVADFSDNTAACKLLDEILKSLKTWEQCNSACARTLIACLRGGVDRNGSEKAKCLEKVEIVSLKYIYKKIDLITYFSLVQALLKDIHEYPENPWCPRTEKL